MTPTRYIFEVACEDLGEYDVQFLADGAVALAVLMKEIAVIGFSVSTSRRRADEPAEVF